MEPSESEPNFFKTMKLTDDDSFVNKKHLFDNTNDTNSRNSE